MEVMWLVVACLGLMRNFFLWVSSIKVEAIEPTLYCTRWFAAIVGWKRLQDFCWGCEISPLGCWTGGIAVDSSKIHWPFEDSRPLKGPFVLLKGAMKPKCWKHFRFFLNQSYTQTKCWKFQVFFWKWLNLIIHDISISSWILPHVAGDGGGGCTKECQKTPQMCKKKEEFRVIVETGSVWMWGGKGHEKKTPPIAWIDVYFNLFREDSIRPKSCVGIPPRETAGFRTLIRALCEPWRTSNRFSHLLVGFRAWIKFAPVARWKGKWKEIRGITSKKGCI